MEKFDLGLQCHWGDNSPNWQKKNVLVNVITLEPGPPNLAIKCILGRSWSGLYMAKFDLDLQGHLAPKRSKLTENGIFRVLTFEGL